MTMISYRHTFTPTNQHDSIRDGRGRLYEYDPSGRLSPWVDGPADSDMLATLWAEYKDVFPGIHGLVAKARWVRSEPRRRALFVSPSDPDARLLMTFCENARHIASVSEWAHGFRAAFPKA